MKEASPLALLLPVRRHERGGADLVITNVRVIVGNGTWSIGHHRRAGQADLVSLAGSGRTGRSATRTIDARGATALPGFIDAIAT